MLQITEIDSRATEPSAAPGARGPRPVSAAPGLLASYPELDALRGLAAFAVILGHFLPGDMFLNRGFHFGRAGVVLFFILSGFLIVNILLEARAQIEAGHSLGAACRTFYLRRVLRIFPLYFAVLLFFCAIGYGPVTSRFWWHAAYLSNFGSGLFGLDFGNLEHFWSLCVEEQFYFVIPLIVLALPVRWSWRIIAGLCVGGMAAKGILGVLTHSWLTATRLPFANLEGLCYGATIAYALRNPRLLWILRRAARMLTIPALLALAALQGYRAELGPKVYDTPLYIAAIDAAIVLSLGPIVLAIAQRPSGAGWAVLRVPPLRYLGRISYGTYVYHYAMIPLLTLLLAKLGLGFQSPQHQVLSLALCTAITLAVAAVSWHLLESPILRLKDRLPREHPKAPAIGE